MTTMSGQAGAQPKELFINAGRTRHGMADDPQVNVRPSPAAPLLTIVLGAIILHEPIR